MFLVGRRQKLAVLVAVGVIGWTATSAADPAPPTDPATEPATPAAMAMPTPHLHLGSGDGILIAPDGTTRITIPKGSHVLDGPSWDKLDAEVSRLQAAETSLTAENKVLKSSVEGWQPGWKMLAGALVVGLGAGWYAHSKL